MTQHIMIFSTCPDEAVADRIARSLVEQKLAACVNILPAIKSVYSWKDKIESDQESLLIIKSTQSRFKELSDMIQQQHPYELPEILAVPIEAGLPEYLNWIVEQTT